MRDFDAAVDAIYEASLDRDQWNAAAGAISSLFEGRPTLIMVDDTRTGALPLTASAGITSDAWRIVGERFATLETNPMLAVAMTIPLHEAVDQAAAIGEDVFRASRINAEVYVPQGQWPFLGTVAARNRDMFAGLAIMRPIDGPRPEPQHFELAGKLSVHLGRALALGQMIGNPAVPASTFEAALHQVREPVLLLKVDGEIVWANDQAKALLQSRDGLLVRSKRLATTDQAGQRSLATAIETATRADEFVLPIARQDGPPHIVRVQRIPHRIMTGPGTLMVTIATGRRRTRFTASEAAAMFGLTPAEARVACEICASPGLDAVAGNLAISLNTVKSLLRRVYEKTGTHSQAELAMLFATSLRPAAHPDAGEPSDPR